MSKRKWKGLTNDDDFLFEEKDGDEFMEDDEDVEDIDLGEVDVNDAGSVLSVVEEVISRMRSLISCCHKVVVQAGPKFGKAKVQGSDQLNTVNNN